MTIINAVGSLPGLGRLILNHVICSENSVESAKLIDDLLPEPLRTGLDPLLNLNSTLIALKGAGLLQESESVFSTTRLVDTVAGGEPVGPERFRRLLQRSIAASIDDDPWILAEGDTLTSGTKDLTRALSWFLAQDVQQTFTWDKTGRGLVSAEVLQREQLPNEQLLHPFANDVRWGIFGRWATALGMAEPALAGTGLHPDAIVAIRDVTGEMPPDTYKIDDYLSALGRHLPVINGGALHTSLLQHTSEPDPDASNGWLDSSVAQALIGLEEEKLITILPVKADASSRTIGLGSEPRRVTHVRINQEGPR